ncbi:MAG: glycosyltransferase family 4 protein [Candidatus Firestonebacteria bacterium]|nr:glycosyltransferase family 4 protein [Candidatus Firestonebacteria bacterium]
MNIIDNRKIAYMLSSFPSIAQTFVIREIYEVKKELPVVIVSLTGQKRKSYRIHEQALGLVKETYYFPGIISIKLWQTIFSVFKNSHNTWTNLWKEGRRTYVRLEKSGYLDSIFFILKMLYYSRVLQNENVYHIHVHFAEKETTAGLVLADALNITFSFTAHGRDLFLQNISTLTEKQQKAGFMVLISEYTKNYFISSQALNIKADTGNVLRIYMGINPLDYNFISFKERKEMLNTNGGIPYIITVGRLVDEKGYPYILGACRILKEQGLKFKYTIVGKGSRKKILQFKKLCRVYHIDDCVEILGALTMEEILPLYNRAQLFVLGSVREGLPVVLMEALSCGIPTVATNITGIPELIKNGENGILVSSGDERVLAEAMKKLLTDDVLAEKFSIAGRKTILETFDIKKTAKDLIQAFNTQLNKI